MPLSRDHHDALVEVLHLRRAPGRPDAARRFLDFFRSDLEGHMADEEEVVLPAVAGAAVPGSARILEEHGALREMAAALQSAIERENGLEAPMEAIGRLLHDHVRYEERVYFMDVQGALTGDDLARMGAALEARRAARGAGASCRLPPR